MPPRRFSNIQHPNTFSRTLSNLLILLVVLLAVLAVLLAVGLRRPQNFLAHRSGPASGSPPEKSLDASAAVAETPQDGKEKPQPPCNCAALLADPPSQNTNMAAGEAFTQTWRITNSGTCSWNGDYEIFFASGTDLGGPQAKKFGATVSPGETIDISLPLVAVASGGDYVAAYQLRSDDGVGFGIDKSCDQPLWVSISIAGE